MTLPDNFITTILLSDNHCHKHEVVIKGCLMIFTCKPRLRLLKGGLSRSMRCTPTPRDWNWNGYFSLPPSLSLPAAFNRQFPWFPLSGRKNLSLLACLCPSVCLCLNPIYKVDERVCKLCIQMLLLPLPVSPSVLTVRARKRFFLIWIRFAM